MRQIIMVLRFMASASLFFIVHKLYGHSGL